MHPNNHYKKMTVHCYFHNDNICFKPANWYEEQDVVSKEENESSDSDDNADEWIIFQHYFYALGVLAGCQNKQT